MKYESGNFFSLPNEIFLLGLNAGELAVYSFLRRCENRKTHQCWPSVKTIGQAVRMSENTVRKYIHQLRRGGSSPASLLRSPPSPAAGETVTCCSLSRP